MPNVRHSAVVEDVAKGGEMLCKELQYTVRAVLFSTPILSETITIPYIQTAVL